MHEFTIDQSSFRKKQELIYLSNIFIMMITFIGFGALAMSGSNHTIAPYWFVPIFIMLGSGIYKSVKRQQHLFESYKLTIDDNAITSKQQNTPTITIPCDAITSIVKNGDGSFRITSRKANAEMYIPAHVANYEQLEHILNDIEPVTVNKTSISQQVSANIAAVIATVGLMVCVYVADNKVLVGASGFLLLLVMSFCFAKIQLSKNVSKQIRRTSYWLIVVLIAILAIVYHKLTV